MASDESPIYVTQPSLPALQLLSPYLEKIWNSKILTNGGEFHRELEAELCRYLGIQHISLFANGTLALITALQALDITGEVITTPYSFVATSNAILWNRLKPVFVDVEPGGFNLDPLKIEEAITPDTSAILPVHCYGYPCNVDEIDAIARRNNLKVIYDAAHAFGVKRVGKELLNFGDLSIMSFHATKVFNTFEGGAIISPNQETKLRIDQLKNFGFVDETTVVAAGINGKMSELNSAIGLLQLRSIDCLIEKRKSIDARYRNRLGGVCGITNIEPPENCQNNYAYYPILVEENYPLTRDGLYQLLRGRNIFARRYFYPLISDLSPYTQYSKDCADESTPQAKIIAEKIICLPIHPELSESDIDRVVECIAAGETLRN